MDCSSFLCSCEGIELTVRLARPLRRSSTIRESVLGTDDELRKLLAASHPGRTKVIAKYIFGTFRTLQAGFDALSPVPLGPRRFESTQASRR